MIKTLQKIISIDAVPIFGALVKEMSKEIMGEAEDAGIVLRLWKLGGYSGKVFQV